MKLISATIAVLFLASCTKSVDNITGNITANASSTTFHNLSAAANNQLIEYKILKGQQYCDKSTYKLVEYASLSFVVKFDSTAIYKTTDPANQEDINKLFGFSDNNAQHQQYSARFGWRWSNNALRLFGYTYNNSIRSSKELGSIDIGTENNCSIKVSESVYIFTLNGKSQTMPRESKTTKAEGYQLYPYFGGDEVAPHNISIWMKVL
ncbi:hypothetical protein [Segetibacter koreensis]|uniref:hypothetical protein n=1 Tax=Segetibacter koreensis TaxID=398037 RepID=UPI000368057B|nr:hypothetical protein [Segetibacter koreensis]